METAGLQQVANALSTLTIMSCLFLKVPQIMHVRETKSSQGIYVQAMVMEVTGFTIMTLYNFKNGYSLMTYLEYPIILLQVYVLFYYVLKYKRMLKMPLLPFGVLMYTVIVAAFVFGVLPKDYLSYLVPFCTPLSGFAKVTYIYGIIMSENADAVSLTTWVISVTTNLARIFTVYVDSADIKLMANFAISTLLSLAVLVTAFLYQQEDDVPPQSARRRTTCSKRPY